MSSNVVKFERRETPPPPPADFDIASALERCRAMVELLSRQTFPGPEHEAYAVLLLINLKDLVAKARAQHAELTFADHVQRSDGVSNVTELIIKMRNAACHTWSPSQKIGESSFAFVRFFGYCPNGGMIDGRPAGCDFEDDVALYFGPYRLYLRRHVGRAIAELAAFYNGGRG